MPASGSTISYVPPYFAGQAPPSIFAVPVLAPYFILVPDACRIFADAHTKGLHQSRLRLGSTRVQLDKSACSWGVPAQLGIIVPANTAKCCKGTHNAGKKKSYFSTTEPIFTNVTSGCPTYFVKLLRLSRTMERAAAAVSFFSAQTFADPSAFNFLQQSTPPSV